LIASPALIPLNCFINLLLFKYQQKSYALKDCSVVFEMVLFTIIPLNISHSLLKSTISPTSIINLLNKFIGQDIFITLIQNSNNSLIINQEDNEKRLCSRLGIPFLNFLSIPSRYKLIMMCAQNRKFSLGTKIDFKTGEKYIEPKEKEDITLPLFYSRYETKCIDDEFIYINTELTGDINYDIDLVYGLLDTNNTQGIDPSNYQANINSIKRKNDIIIRECDGKYLIRNGRHRLLYLKYIYSLYFKSYEKEGILDTLRRNLTIPLYIEKTYSDEINNIVKQLKEKYSLYIIFKRKQNLEYFDKCFNAYITKFNAENH